jgi:hypothetical protein
VAAGISSLWGPAHGGANEAVLNMLKEIGSVDNIRSFIKHVKDQNDDPGAIGFTRGFSLVETYNIRWVNKLLLQLIENRIIITPFMAMINVYRHHVRDQ